MQAFITTE